MTQAMKKTVLGLLIVFGGLIGFNLIKGALISHFFSNFSPPAVTVSAIYAQQRDWEPQIHAVGNFVAIHGVDVNPEASGRVSAIHFESGQYVPAFTPLIDIDDSIDQATLQANQSELALQEINYKRQVDLAKHGATSGSSVDEARAKLLQAQAGVQKTEAEIRKKHIVAPFAGQLGIRQINLGQYVTPGQTPIVSLQSMDPLYLEFYLPEQRFKDLHLNQPITFSVEQNPNVLFEGRITALNSRVDTSTHTIEVQATLANCPAKALTDPTHSSLVQIKQQPHDPNPLIVCDSARNEKNTISTFTFIPGMFADIHIEEPLLPKVIVLPTTAISYSLYGNSVYVIEKDKDHPEFLVVKRIFVSTGDQQGNDIIITKGISAHQHVVSSGELKLQDGTRVVINNDVPLTALVTPKQLGE